jgi:hypothetical protein
MASRLFHTIVGVGISLSAAACSSAPAEEPIAHDDSSYLSGTPSTPAPTAPTTSTPPKPPCTDAGTPTGPDWDAFCDATWPTTKGGVIPVAECIDPKHECKDKGDPFECATPGKAPGACAAFDQFLSVCAEKTWQCKPGRINTKDCKCWEWDGGTTCETSSADAAAGK